MLWFLTKEENKEIMARPTTIIPLDGGEIVLRNCTKETIEAVRALVTTAPTEAPAVPEATVTPSVPATPTDSPLECTAIGVYQNPLTLSWHLTSLKYSPYSKIGKVETDVSVGHDKMMCDEKFKIAAVNSNLVG